MEGDNEIGMWCRDTDGEEDSNRVNKGKSGLVLNMSGKKLGLKRNDKNDDGVRLDKMGDGGEKF